MTDTAASPLPALLDIAGRVADAAVAAGRDDLAGRVRTAMARASRPATIVCVVGEFKQGKSSLVNALLARPVCPVDDDLATAVITLVRHVRDGERPGIEVRHRVAGEVVSEHVADGEIAGWVTEAANRDNSRDVERVEVAIVSALLASGLCLVDTPGMGGLGAGHAAATLAFLPFADGLVFVSDASAELSEPEAAFLARARELCPSVVMALTKVDLYPHWREIQTRNAAHLARLGCDAPILAVSSALRSAAMSRRDGALDRRSGYPALFQRLRDGVIEPAKSVAADRAAGEAAAVLGQLRVAAENELAVVDDPGRLAATLADAERARERLEHLRGPGARWSVLVGDRVTDLSNDVAFGFRAAMRRIVRTVEDAIEEMKKPAEWDDLARRLQTEVGDAVTAAFTQMDTGAVAITSAVVELLAEDALSFPLLGTRNGAAVDVAALWSAKPLDPRKGRAGAALTSGITGLRGAQSGIVMFGMMGRFLPMGVGALMVSNPVTLSMGAVFGGMQVLDAHRRKLAQRRQQARVAVRQFADDVQFEVGNLITEGLRSIQRELRDEFTRRIGELHRTCAQVAQTAQEAAVAGSAARETRGTQLRADLVRLDSLDAAVVALRRTAS